MSLELSPERQRWAAIGITLLMMLIAVWLVVLPLWEQASLHAQRVTMLKRQVATMEVLVEARPKFEAEINKLSANPDIQNLTFAADQPALAVAQLQGQLNQTFATAAASVTSSQVLPEVREGSLTKVTLQMTVEADIRSLVKALHAIGAARPLLTIEKLSVKDPDGDWAVNPQALQVNKLQVEIVVSAYMRAT
ncbi:MAG: type II secretion system protein GspM [Micropepsaceae bacterium]